MALQLLHAVAQLACSNAIVYVAASTDLLTAVQVL